MTRAVRDRILKDVNGDISDHLRNHIHLTNCIHLKNHMHKHSPISADRSLMRDLVVLQRSRSLRDPTASPHSWHSPSVVDLLLKLGEKDDLVAGRRSVGIEHPVLSVSDRRANVEESSRRFMENDLIHRSVSGNSELRDKKKEGYRQDISHLKTLVDQLKDIPDESDDAASFSNHSNKRHTQVRKIAKEGRPDIRSHGNSLNRAKRRRYRGARRSRGSIATLDVETQNEISVASNSFGQEHDDQNVSGVPRNGCGVPWNWSRIHHRGKSFIDMAGRSLSCGLSESRLKRGGKEMGFPDMHVMSEHSSSSTNSNREALPLLLEASGSQGSIDRAAWHHDYSGELGIFADNLLKQDIEIDSDLASEGGSRKQKHKFRRHCNRSHQNLTQKYMPRTFRDLVGQNLVVQALSNAVVKRKVGLLYLFYGPQGTGKTSCARIFARALNCQSLEQPKPCGLCNSCIAHEMGKSRNVMEIGRVSIIDIESIIDLLDNMTASRVQSQYRVFIFDECDSLSPECWNAILKVIDRAPRRVVFVLVSSSLDVLPHVIISRCQKFIFPKLKDADIIYTLQWIATKEDLEIDKDALKLIASRSDGSLRDAEMALEQLSLLGKRISLGLAGLISDEKLVDLLDLALSADTVNTVKNLRDIVESGVEPLALMSQLATVITDILAGSYDFMKERPRRKFFRRQALSKEDMEKLRQALKTLSEAEKQLRVSNDRVTWLTAALLQLAPDQQYMLPSSSADTSFNHSPLVLDNASLRERPIESNPENAFYNAKLKGVGMDGKGNDAGGVVISSNVRNQVNKVQLQGNFHRGIEEVWLEVLENIPINSVKEFMYREGKLISLSYGAAATVQLLFNSQLAKSKAEKFRIHVLQAFESVLRSPVAIEIRYESKKDVGRGPILLPPSHQPSRLDVNPRREIVEIEASPKEYNGVKLKNDKANSAQNPSSLGDRNESLSLVRSRISLGNVIQQVDGSSQHSGWSKRKAVTIAEKLEQENLRLEPRSRRLLCWNPPRVTRRKLSRLKIRTRKPQSLLKFVSCGRCLSARSPRQCS
ncbi:hypothetical protein BUALT_Bualt18G0119400 [Buddleja alternifolia]|uniref:AAA+ ATPase domain-containing protein n=1 Tax=Buddleja alternifolia TaxID=168488 RepID=A0AAV6WAT9_9LAMI|nr:hypothetical protein BUALT_Bualt18G0119400 [Buddleja alternifolia]